MRIRYVVIAVVDCGVAAAVGCHLASRQEPPVASQSEAITEAKTQGGGVLRQNNFVDPLTQTQVQNASFGLKFRRQVRGAVYAQPLVVTVTDSSHIQRNLVIVATMNNEVYAFDADSTAINAPPIWKINLRSVAGAPTVQPAHLQDPAIAGGALKDTHSEIGIEGTPAMGPPLLANPAVRPLYLVAHSHVGGDYYTNAGGTHAYYLYKFDIDMDCIEDARELIGLVPPEVEGLVAHVLELVGVFFGGGPVLAGKSRGLRPVQVSPALRRRVPARVHRAPGLVAQAPCRFRHVDGLLVQEDGHLDPANGGFDLVNDLFRRDAPFVLCNPAGDVSWPASFTESRASCVGSRAGCCRDRPSDS